MKNLIRFYETVQDEYNALCNGVGLRDISNCGLIELKGKDCIDYVHRISTNKILEIKDNTVEYTIFTNEKGRIIDRVKVLRFGDSLFLLGSAYFHKNLMSWINKYIIVEDIKTFDAAHKFSIFEVWGPQAESFITLIFGKEVDTIKNFEIKTLNLDNAFYRVIKLEEFGTKKYIIISDAPNGEFLVSYMNENKSVFDFRMIGEDAFETFRIEKGIPTAPNELNDFYNPHEANIINEVSFTKGCYIGQEVIARLDTYDKVQKHLKGISFNFNFDTSDTYSLFMNGNEVGQITSLTNSPFLQKTIGLAYIKKDFEKDGTILIAKNSSGEEFPVFVNCLPFRK